MKRTTLSIIALAILLVPFVASACSLPDVWNPGTLLNGPLVTCGAPKIMDSNGNLVYNSHACANLCDLVCTAANVIYFGIAFVIWIIAPLMIVVGGIMYMLGGANPGLLETAKKALWGAVIGVVIVLCAYILISVFIQFLQISKIGGFNGTPSCTLSS